MNNLFKLTFLFFFFLISINLNVSHAQVFPTFNMTVKNITTVPGPNGRDSLCTFDIYCQHTNLGVSDPFEYAACQFSIYYNKAIQQPGSFLQFIRVSSAIGGTSLVAPTTQVDSTFGGPTNPNGLLKTSGNIPDPAANYFINSVFPGTRILTMRLRTNAHHWPNVPLNLSFKLGAAPNSFISYLLPYPQGQDTEVNPNQFAQNLMDTVANVYSVDNSGFILPPASIPPTANFYANMVAITAGNSINFIDSSLNAPTSWSWTFAGGTPSASTLRNPVGIVYNTPGTYSVSLMATNAYGSNTKTKSNYITVNPSSCTTVWQNTIKIKDAGNIKDSLILGTSVYGTNGIDTCLGESPLPPVPPEGSFDIRFIQTGFDSKIDIRKDSSGDLSWLLKFQPSSSGFPMTFTWNSNSFPSTGFVYLRDLFGGAVVNVNMLSQSSYTLTNPAITSLKIEFNSKLNQLVKVKSGWNILSSPLLAADMKVTSLFPLATSLAYGYNNVYVIADSLKNGYGYWLKFNRDTSYNIFGFKVSPKNIPVVSGWNLIGPFDENIPVSSIVSVPAGIVTSSYYGFSNTYFIPDTLKAGSGYWIRSSSTGILMKNLGDNEPDIVSGDSMNNWTKILISDQANTISNLYLTNSNQITRNYDLPPVPPEEVFDIRFSSDKFVEAFGQNHIIKINNASLPLKIKALNLNNIRLRIVDAVTGNLYNKVLEENTEIELNQNLDNLVLIEENLIPDTYSLNQNYPNPFNPSTTIKYQIASNGTVKLTVYDVLGKEVQTLVNQVQEAGYYELKFNPQNLASGMYFYRLQSGSFSEIKRMLLIK